MRDNQVYYVFSVFNNDSSLELNTIRHTELLKALPGTNKEVVGCYKGKQELSIVTALPLDKVLSVAKTFGQESILVLESDNTSSLYMVSTGEVKPIGILETLSKQDALKLDAWSYRADLDQYYAIKGVK